MNAVRWLIREGWWTVSAVAAQQATAMWTQMVNFLQMGVIAIGGVIGVLGAIKLFEGLSDSNGPQMSQGGKQLIGGALIMFVGIVLVPMLSGFITAP